MKLSYKPEYNENVVDVDALEKQRIAAEAETERRLIVEQELTKREVCKRMEDTKQSDSYKTRVETAIICSAIVFGLGILSSCCVGYNYTEVLKQHVEVQRLVETQKLPPSPACPECPKVNCQAVPAK